MASTLLTRRAMTCSTYGPLCWIPTRRISNAFISAEGEVVRSPDWVCIPTF